MSEVKVENQLVTEIESLSHEGRGISRINGKTTFIDNALPGETVAFEYVRSRSKFSTAKATQIIKPSEKRITPKCEVFGICGGCSLQHLSSQDQIAHKQSVLLELLQHSANVQPQSVLTPLQANPWQYRFKARLGIRYDRKKDQVLVGFREKHNSRFITNMSRCEIMHPHIGEHIEDFKSLIKKLSILRDVPQIEVAISDNETALIFRHLKPFTDEDLSLIKSFGETFNYKIYLQAKGLKSIELFYPKNADFNLVYENKQHGVQFKFAPFNFTQVNPEINVSMINQVIELMNLNKDDNVLDLFCGLGNFSLPIAKYVNSIVGVEGEQTMVDLAKSNAELNNLSNCEFYVADLFAIHFTESWSKKPFNKIVIDPPRSGAAHIVENINKFKPDMICYISCNPSTLARDTDTLIKAGFQLIQAGVMDMFPHTAHVESIALFKRKT